MRYLFILLLGFFTISSATAQTSGIGGKAGLTVGLQKWNSQNRQPLFQYNASFVYEKMSSDKFSYLLELGYNVKGSANRSNYYDLQGNLHRFTSRDKFNNLSIMGGAKSVLDFNLSGGDIYYLLGARVDFNVSDSVQSVANFSQYINRFTFGVTVGGGIQFDISEKSRIFFELTVSPDFSQQAYVFPGSYYANYNGTTVLVQLQEQKVINTTIELTVGFKLLRY